MTALLVVLDAALTLAAGAALSGLVRTHLTLMERALIGITSGLLVGTAATYGLSLLAGLNIATVLARAGARSGRCARGVLADRRIHARRGTRRGWSRGTAGRSASPGSRLLAMAGGVAVVIAIFAHTVYSDAGGLEAGYPTVWADWSQHLTTAASFASGGNIPPVNPLFSGTTLLYPFLPDFHAATLMTLGLAPGLALAIPGGMLVVGHRACSWSRSGGASDSAPAPG